MKNNGPEPAGVSSEPPASGQREKELAVLGAANDKISTFTVGFTFLEVANNKERPRSGGSGTLVQIGKARGILTAAHVTSHFGGQDEVGLVLYEPLMKRRRQSFRFRPDHARVFARGPGESVHGPDLAFVQLPHDVIATLEARASFFNLSKRREAVLNGEIKQGRKYFDCVVGTVAEHSPGIVFNGVMQTGNTKAMRPKHGLDLMLLSPDRGPNDRPIRSYQGVSGGGLWRIYVKERSKGDYEFQEACVFGVAFREGMLKRGKRAIKCHGPESVYRTLLDQVTAAQ